MINEYGAYGGNKNWQEKPKYSEKTQDYDSLSTINPTRSDLKPGPLRWKTGDRLPELWRSQHEVQMQYC
jgi:Ni/Co efflux regulator RcnB